MMQDVHTKMIRDCHGNSSNQQEEKFHQQILLKSKEEN
jgi:hypothetical protein